MMRRRITNPTMNQLLQLKKRLNDGTLLRLRKPRSDLCLEVITREEKTNVGDY